MTSEFSTSASVVGGRSPCSSFLSDRYIGIDYSASMVDVCKERYPRTDIRLGDATNLSGLDDHSVDFVFFSFNGIDTMGERDRVKVYQAVHRVLDVEGLFAFSTLNKNGRSYAETPFQLHRPPSHGTAVPRLAPRLLLRNCRDPLRLLRRYRNWWSTRSHALDENGWATCTLSAFDFTLVNHFVTLPRLREELSLAGFEVLAIYGSDKSYGPLAPDATASTDDSFYALARRR